MISIEKAKQISKENENKPKPRDRWYNKLLIWYMLNIKSSFFIWWAAIHKNTCCSVNVSSLKVAQQGWLIEELTKYGYDVKYISMIDCINISWE